jgi:hypothetical protein
VVRLQDDLSPWYARLRAHGEIPTILIGRSIDRRTIEWRAYPHEYYDAIGAFLDAVRKNHYDAPLKALAERLARARASRGQSNASAAERSCGGGVELHFSAGNGEESHTVRLKRWVRRLSQKSEIVLDNVPPWRDWDEGVPTAPVPPAATWLTREQTRAIHAAAREDGASLNSYILCALDRSIDELLVDPWAPRHWTIGVNLRGSVPDLSRDTANYSSALYIRTKAGYSPKDINDATREALRRGVHLAQWTKQHAITRLGGHIVEQVIRGRFERPRYATAMMSHGGQWPPVPVRATAAKQDDPAEREQWFAAGFPSRFCAILSGTLEWYGRMSLTLSIHPAIADAQTKTRETMLRWREKLINGI